MIRTTAAATIATAALLTANPAEAIPRSGMQGLRPNAAAIAEYVANTYPGVQSIGGVRPDALPDHPSGRAIDIMIGNNTALGDTIAADIKNQAVNFGVNYVIWRAPAHYDHIHVSVF